MKKPIIGLIAKHDDASKRRTESVLRDEMKDAIIYNGGIAIGILSPKKQITLIDSNENKTKYTSEQVEQFLSEQEKLNLVAQIKLCDGIILSGGPNSDDYEVWVAKYAHDNNIPLLAICAGQNNFIRGIGGTVKRVDNKELHARPNDEYVHSMRVVEGTKYHKILNTTKMAINSRHQNILDDVAGLTICAYDEYGNIEAVEDETKKFFISMRFHPESLYLQDEKHNAIFKAFIAACK